MTEPQFEYRARIKWARGNETIRSDARDRAHAEHLLSFEKTLQRGELPMQEAVVERREVGPWVAV